VGSEEISRDVPALQQEIATLLGAEREAVAAIAALEAELTERRDGLMEGRQAIADAQAHIEQKRAELEKAIARETRERFEEVIRERDAAAASLAEVIELLLERLAELDRSQDTARAARTDAHGADAVDRISQTQMPRELEVPEVMRESWERLCREIRNRIGEQFEDELVDAASRSPLGSAIDDLPTHLRELARQRRRALLRGERDPGATESDQRTT
jgi:chromosome segregation ATPase